MANKLLDAIRGIFGKKPEHNLDSTGKPVTSAAPASTPTTTPTTQPQQPQQQAPVYKDNSVVYKNEQGNGGIYQYNSPDKLKSQNELNEQWKYAMQLGYSRDQAIEALRNGTRWKNIALGQNGRPIVSYQGGKYASQEEVNEQYAIASGMGMKRDDIVKAMQQGIRWREQTDDDLKEEYTAGSYGNAANNKRGALGNLGWMYENGSERHSTVAGNKKYWDILNADDFAEKSKPGEAKTRAFGGDRRYDYINDIGNTRAVEDTAAAGRMGTSEFAKYGFMTDDEVGIYNYLYATKGKQAANQFLDEIDSQLNEQRATGIENSMSQVANESGWNQAAMTGVTALAAPVRGISGMAAMAQDAYDTWRGNEIDPNSRFHRMSNNTNAVRQAIGDSLGKQAGDFVAKKWAGWSGGKEAAEAVVPWTYDVVTSALDSMMNALTGSYLAGTGFQPGMSLKSLWDATNKITTVIMSSEAAANGVALSKEKGYSNFGALSLGFYRGMMEYLSEKYGGDWVNKKIAGDQANFWVYAARAFIPEFLEEIASDVGNEMLNVPLDILAGTDESYIVNAYKELEAAGSENIWGDLAKVIMTEELKSGLSGGLSALGTGAGRFNNYRTTLTKSALTLNTDTKTLSEMMRRNDIDDPGHVARMVELYDVNSVEEFETELAKYKDIADAIDARMAEQGQREAEQQAQQQTTPQQTAAQFAEDDKLGEYEAIALDNITSLSDDELIEYTQLLRNIIDQYSNGDEAQQELADGRYQQELEAAMAEGQRRQGVREAPAQQAESQPKNPAATQAQPTQGQEQSVDTQPNREYNSSAVKSEPQKTQPAQKKAESKPADNSYDGYSDEELEKRKTNIDKRIVAMQRSLDSNDIIDEERRHLGNEIATLRLESGAIEEELHERSKNQTKQAPAEKPKATPPKQTEHSAPYKEAMGFIDNIEELWQLCKDYDKAWKKEEYKDNKPETEKTYRRIEEYVKKKHILPDLSGMSLDELSEFFDRFEKRWSHAGNYLGVLKKQPTAYREITDAYIKALTVANKQYGEQYMAIMDYFEKNGLTYTHDFGSWSKGIDEKYTVIKKEGAQNNGSNQGNADTYSSIGRQAENVGAESGNVRGQSGENLEENARARRSVEAAEESGNRGVSEEGQADTTTQRNNGQRNSGDQTVQRSVAQERSGRVTRIFSALEKHFNFKKIFANASQRTKDIQNAAAFAGNTLRSVFGSRANASKFVNAWMADPVNDMALAIQLGQVNSRNRLTQLNSKMLAQVLAANQIMQDFLNGDITAQDIADIGGFNLDEAKNIVAGAEQKIQQALNAERITDKNGEPKGFQFRKKARADNRKSGRGSEIANIAEGQRVGTAKVLERMQRYVAQTGDQEVDVPNDYGNKVYRRGDTYYVVNKGGYVFSTANDDEDVENALRYAQMAAKKSSPSYDVANAHLFADGIFMDDNDGIILNQDRIFSEENMDSVYGSLASDLMDVAYSDMEKGTRRGTTNWFKMDMNVRQGDVIGSLTSATKTIRKLIQASYSFDENGNPIGIPAANGKRYVFFGMTSSGAKKGECIMVDREYYKKLRKASLSGLTEQELKDFNPAKYLTTSTTIFTPSNADLGIKIAPDFKKNGMGSVQVAVIGDLYTIRPDTLRQFMRVDNVEDRAKLIETFTSTMTRKLKALGMSQEQIDEEVAKADIEARVDEIIDHNAVGSIVNIMGDMMFQVTDGTGFIDIPEGSPYEGQSTQMRSLGGFKAQLVGFRFSDYLHDVIPFNPNAEYLYNGEDGEIAGGFRYIDKDVGVEVRDRWGTWIPVKQLKAVLFDSTVKFAGQFDTSEDFYNHTGDADLRSIPRENVYGGSVSDSAIEGSRMRGLSQFLRSQLNFTEDEVKSVISPRLDEFIDNVRDNPDIAAKMFGVNFDGPAPSKADGKAYAIWLQGRNFFQTWDGKRWLAEKIGKTIEDMRSGRYLFKDGESAFGWVDPDTIGLIHAMTAITRIYNETGDIVSQSATEGGGYGINGYAGLTPGQIFSANLSNANNDNRTAVGRFPSTKAIDVQIRENVSRDDPNYQLMVEKYGLDKANIYVAINDTLSMYLDNDYDGDPITTFQGALADLYSIIRSRDNTDSKGNKIKKNVLVATAKGIQQTDTEALGVSDLGPVEFSHAKAKKVAITAKVIEEAVRRYLEVNDSTEQHQGPKPVGVYDNMVERLAAIPDDVLAKPAAESGMDVSEYRALMEARFGVAYVLSIDYAKTGNPNTEFFSMIEELDAMLYDIAEENKLITPREVSKKTGKKVTKKDSFVPSWWKYSNSGSKQEKARTTGKLVENPNTLLSTIQRILNNEYSKRNRSGEADERFGNWYNGLKQKLGRGNGLKPDWAGGMTNSREAYSHLSDKFFNNLSNVYRDITASDNPEFLALKKRYEKAGKKVLDMDIRSYLIYKNIQQKLGLNNEQFTDLMLEMLSRTGQSSGTILAFDQSKIDPKNTETTTADIFQRNVELTKTFEQAANSLAGTFENIKQVGKKLLESRGKISELLESRKTTLNALDAALVARIGRLQSSMEQSNQSLRDNFNELYRQTQDVKNGNVRGMTTDDLDAYRDTYEDMRQQLATLKENIQSSDSVFASKIAYNLIEVLDEVDAELRNTLRQINTLEKTLNSLYNAYTNQIGKAEAVAEATSGVFTEATTGLEGLTEEQIIKKLEGTDSGTGSNSEQDNQRGREGVHDQSSAGRESGRGEVRPDNSREQESSERANGQAEEITVNQKNESALQSGTKLSGEYLLLETDSHYKMVANIDPVTGETSIISRDANDAEIEKFVIDNNGTIVPTKSMTAPQRATQRVLRRFGIHIIYTTENLRGASGSHTGEVLSGATVRIKDAKTGQRFIFANVGNNERRISVRHEVAHALCKAMGGGYTSEELLYLGAFIRSIPSITNGLISESDVNDALDKLPDTYKKNKLDQYQEFIAHLLSGDDFYGANPTMAETFMRLCMEEYHRTGGFPILYQLLRLSNPGATDSDIKAMIDFFTDPYKEADDIYARAATEETSTAEETTTETTTEAEPTDEEQPNEQLNAQPNEPQPEPPSFGGKRRNIARSIVKIQRAVDTTIARLNALNGRNTESHVAILSDFNNSLKQFLNGDITAKDLYLAYNNLKGTMFYDEEVEPFFNELADPRKYYIRDAAGGITGLADAYNEAVDHAFAKMGAFAQQVVNAEQTNAQLTNESVKREEKNIGQKALNYLGSWQVNAPTWFKALVGYKKGSVGYKLARMIENSNKMMQRHYWGAYQHLQNVAKMSGYQDLISGKYHVDVDSKTISDTPFGITVIEAINLYRMMKSVKYTQGSLDNVVGFRRGDDQKIRTAFGHGKMRTETAQTLYERLDEYFKYEARPVEKAYLQALDNIYGYFTPEVQRVGKALNGYVDMIPAEEYSPVYWGTNKVEESFDPKEAQLKSDPRYMKERIEEAGGYLNINPMDEVIETYIRKMSDYLAFGEAREQLRLMNKTADFRDTKTLGQIAGENMGESYARFINNYVRDFIHYSDNSNSFWYKARMAMQKGTLIGNASVMMKQSASYLNAASVIDMKYLIQALTPTEFGKDYANGKSGLLEYRRITGNFDPTISEMFGKKASKNPFVRAFQNGISIIDYKTVKRLYVAACLQVQAETNYKVGSAEFDEAVENLFSDAAISTQPQFDPSLRAENARTTNEGVRMLSMFRTQQTQNFNKLLTAFGEMKANPDAQSKAQWRATIGGLVGSGLALALFTSIADAALHRKKKYRDKDKDDEITAEKILKRIGMNSAEAIAGTMWFGDDLSKLLIDMTSAATGGDTKEFYGVSMGPVSTIYDAATSLKDFVDAIADGKGVLTAGKKLAGYVTQLGGFPLNNLYNYINTVAMYSKDILGTNPDDYDDFLKWLDSENTAQKRLIRAAEKGNDRKTNNLWEALQKRYANPSSELNEQLHKDYDRGKVSEDTAQNLLLLYGGLEDEDAAKKRVAWWDFKKEHPEYEDMTEANVAKWNSVAEPAGVPLDTFYKATKHFAELRKDKENGKDNLAMLQYIDSLGLTQSQKDALWNCFGTNVYTPYDSTKGVYADYQNYGKPAGFTAEDFTAYYDKCNSFNSDKDKNGKTTKSKQQKVIDYINSLNISKAQKDALFLSMNYKKTSKAWKTRPWR